MYGKINIELIYFLNLRLVLVTRNAVIPPNMIAIRHVRTARRTVFKTGVHRLVFASLDVKRSVYHFVP